MSCHTNERHRGGHANECVDEDRPIAVVGIQRWRIGRMMRVPVTCPMHMDGTTTVMLCRLVVWMRVSQRRAEGGALDSQGQHDSDDLSRHGHIVREYGHLVKRYRKRAH
jgi:hypothetical protein